MCSKVTLVWERIVRDGLLDRGDKYFASDLELLRIQKGMTEEELGVMIGRNAQCIRGYESGAVLPSDWTVQVLNNVLLDRNSGGRTVGDTPTDEPPHFGVKSIPNGVLAAELRFRLLFGTGD